MRKTMNSFSLLPAAGRGRFVTSTLRWLLAAACALGAVAPISAAGADATVDTIVVKFNADAVPSTGAAVEAAVQTATGLALTVSGQTRDGAFRLVFPTPLGLDAARAAINRVRLQAGVLYANVAPGAPIPDTTGRPTDRLIVKYRDAARTAIAASGMALAPSDVNRLTTVAGRPVAWLRGAPDGANVLRSPTTSGRRNSSPRTPATHRPASRPAQAVSNGTSSIRSGASTCRGRGTFRPVRPASMLR
jgi:hypothetical protein